MRSRTSFWKPFITDRTTISAHTPTAMPIIATSELMPMTIRGSAVQIQNGPKDAWLSRFPEQAINFTLADFSFWEIAPRDARFVAGFGRIHNLSAAELQRAAA